MTLLQLLMDKDIIDEKTNEHIVEKAQRIIEVDCKKHVLKTKMVKDALCGEKKPRR